jgi:hypothetical protein
VSIISSFQPTGNTVAVLPATSSANIAVPASAASSNVGQVRVYNGSNQTVYLAWGSTSAVAAAIPVVGTPNLGVPVPPGAVETFSNQGGPTYIAYIVSATATGNLYITPGEGI